jgi:hypothetical protein
MCQVYVVCERKKPLLVGKFQSKRARPDHLEVAGFRVIRQRWVIGAGSGALDDLKAAVGAVGGCDDGAFEVIGTELAGT